MTNMHAIAMNYFCDYVYWGQRFFATTTYNYVLEF